MHLAPGGTAHGEGWPNPITIHPSGLRGVGFALMSLVLAVAVGLRTAGTRSVWLVQAAADQGGCLV